MLPKFLRVALPALGVLAIACPVPAESASFTFSNPNCASLSLVDNGGGNYTVVCGTNPSTPPPAGAPACSLARAPTDGNLPAAGGAVGASLSCTGTVTSYAWRKNGAAFGAAAATLSDALPANSGSAALTTTYDVTACNGAACTSPLVATFVVASGSGGGGAAANNLCAQYANVTYIDVPWGGQAIATSGGGSFAAGGVLVARMAIPADAAYGNGAIGKIQVAEYGDPATYRQATLSQVACDFRGAPGAYGAPGAQSDRFGGSANLPLSWRFGNTATAEFTVTGSSLFYPKLVPGQTYFYSVRNVSQDLANAISCSGSTCNALVAINTP